MILYHKDDSKKIISIELSKHYDNLADVVSELQLYLRQLKLNKYGCSNYKVYVSTNPTIGDLSGELNFVRYRCVDENFGNTAMVEVDKLAFSTKLAFANYNHPDALVKVLQILHKNHATNSLFVEYTGKGVDVFVAGEKVFGCNFSKSCEMKAKDFETLLSSYPELIYKISSNLELGSYYCLCYNKVTEEYFVTQFNNNVVYKFDSIVEP